MSVTDLTLSATGLPVGTWTLDPTHSSAAFAVKHMAVATFRGRFERFDATLTVDQAPAPPLGRAGDELIVAGELTIKGNTHPVEGRGTVDGPAVTLGDVTKLGI